MTAKSWAPSIGPSEDRRRTRAAAPRAHSAPAVAQRGRGGQRCRPPRRRLRVARRVLRNVVPAPRRRGRRRRCRPSCRPGARRRTRGRERAREAGSHGAGGLGRRCRLSSPRTRRRYSRQARLGIKPHEVGRCSDSQRWAARQALRPVGRPHGRRAGVLLQLHHRRERGDRPARRDVPPAKVEAERLASGFVSAGGRVLASWTRRSRTVDPVVGVSRQTRRPRRGRRKGRGSRERVDGRGEGVGAEERHGSTRSSGPRARHPEAPEREPSAPSRASSDGDTPDVSGWASDRTSPARTHRPPESSPAET